MQTLVTIFNKLNSQFKRKLKQKKILHFTSIAVDGSTRVKYYQVHNRTLKHNKVWGMHRLVFPKHRLTFAECSALMPLKVLCSTTLMLTPLLADDDDESGAVNAEPAVPLCWWYRLVSGWKGPALASSEADDEIVDDDEMAELVVNWWLWCVWSCMLAVVSFADCGMSRRASVG